MKMSSVLLAVFALTPIAIPALSHACGGSAGWAVPDDATPKVSLNEAITIAKFYSGVEIKKSDSQSRCGSDLNFEVSDHSSGAKLGVIPVPSVDEAKDDGRTLLVRTKQLLATPREQLVALKQASEAFYNDMRGLEEDLGIGAYVPNAFPIQTRVKNGGQDYGIYVFIAESCDPNHNQSPFNIATDFTIKTIEYIPGRVDYNANTIYQTGDFKKAVLNNKSLMSRIRNEVLKNAQFCKARGTAREASWSEIDLRLKSTPSILAQSATQKLQAMKSQPKDAHMLNENRIAIVTVQGKTEIAGTESEMVDVQKRLFHRGIQTDKSGKLDWKGKIAVDVAKQMKRALPTSLQD